MPREFSRTDRLADTLQRELMALIRAELDDPRLAMVNITGVEVTRDLSLARVWVNFVVPKPAAEAAAAVEALNRASGFLRARLGRILRIRSVPQLRFQYDESGERGQRVSDLIARALAEDRARHQRGEE
ncbi:MAG: ribosome-binding factor A [Porticoccaceae bacterium]|nr:MAG: ribosome-binding factor A [Porticoccaceae bacterium]